MELGSTSSTNNKNKIGQKIENFSELAYFILMKVSSVALMLPVFIATYFKYYIMRLGDASFQDLPYMYGTYVSIFSV